jgi:deoxyribodipyrimidine photo-lyase
MNQSRVLKLNQNDNVGQAVIYVMSRDQRVNDNHALLAAQAMAIEQNASLFVLFNMKVVKNRSREHYAFMLEGLREVSAQLSALDIQFVMQSGDAAANILKVSAEVQAGALYFDFSPLNGSRNRSKKIAGTFSGGVYVVDTHNIIPVWVTSDKREYAAHTMRRKIHLALEPYVIEPDEVIKHPIKPSCPVQSMSFEDAEQFILQIPMRGTQITAKPGEKAASQHLKHFIAHSLTAYAVNRNDIANDQQSGLSPYLHYGHISSLRVALEIITHSDRRPLLFDEVKLASPGDVPSVYS